MSIRPLVLTSVAAVALCAGAHATTFGLESSLGATPTFSVSSGGNTATFSSPAGNGFQVQNTAGLLTFNPALLDSNFFGSDPLTITFSTPISGATLVIPFAFLDSYSTTDSLSVLTNTNQAATFLAVPDGLALGEPEGTATINLAVPTTSVTLSGQEAFAIGDVSTVTPEPSTLVLLATGLAGLAMRRRRTL